MWEAAVQSCGDRCCLGAGVPPQLVQVLELLDWTPASTCTSLTGGFLYCRSEPGRDAGGGLEVLRSEWHFLGETLNQWWSGAGTHWRCVSTLVSSGKVHTHSRNLPFTGVLCVAVFTSSLASGCFWGSHKYILCTESLSQALLLGEPP